MQSGIDDSTEKRPRIARRLGPTTLKLVWLFALGAATLLPVGATSDLIGDRRAHEIEARRWGPEQVVSGPTFMVATPYRE